MTFDDAFDELAGLAYQVAFQVLGSRTEAEEIAQETMTKAYLRWRRVQDHARPWVCRVAINGALGRVRRSTRGRELGRTLGRDQGEVIGAGREHAGDVADRLDLQRLLRSLSRRQRDVVVMRYLADMSEAEVAAELGISVGSVKTHAHRGISSLRAALASPRRDADAEPPAALHAEPDAEIAHDAAACSGNGPHPDADAHTDPEPTETSDV